MPVHGLHRLPQSAPSTRMTTTTTISNGHGLASYPADTCRVCLGLEAASVSGPYNDLPVRGQVHVILESLFLPLAVWLQERNQLMTHENASVNRFIRDKSCKERPALIKQRFRGQFFEFYVGGTVEGDKGPGYPEAMDFFTIPIDPDPRAPTVSHPTHPASYHVHASPRWPSKKQAYLLATEMASKPIVREEEGHIRQTKWTERPKPHPEGPGEAFRFSEQQLSHIETITRAQLDRWMGLDKAVRADMVAIFLRCLDDKSTASTERRENGSQKREHKSDMDYADASDCAVELDDEVVKHRIDEAVVQLETDCSSVASSGKKKRSMKATFSLTSRFMPSLKRSCRSSREPGLQPIPEIVLQHQRSDNGNPRHSFVSASGSEADSDGPRTPEQTSATLSNPHIVDRDDSPAHPGHLSLLEDAHASTLSSPVGIVPVSATSNRRTKLPEVPLRAGESHKESRKSKQRKAKRASIESSRTVKAQDVSDAASSESSGAPEASELRNGSGGLLRRVASMRGLRFK